MAKALFDEEIIPQDTDGLSEGATNKYYTEDRVNANAKVVQNTADAASALAAAVAADAVAVVNAGNISTASTERAALDVRLTALEGGEVIDQTYFNAEGQVKGTAPVDTGDNPTPSEGDRHAELYSNFYTRWAYEGGSWAEKISLPVGGISKWIRTAVSVTATPGDRILCLAASEITVTMTDTPDDASLVIVARKGVSNVLVAPGASQTVEGQIDHAAINLDGRRVEFSYNLGGTDWEAIGITA